MSGEHRSTISSGLSMIFDLHNETKFEQIETKAYMPSVRPVATG